MSTESEGSEEPSSHPQIQQESVLERTRKLNERETEDLKRLVDVARSLVDKDGEVKKNTGVKILDVKTPEIDGYFYVIRIVDRTPNDSDVSKGLLINSHQISPTGEIADKAFYTGLPKNSDLVSSSSFRVDQDKKDTIWSKSDDIASALSDSELKVIPEQEYYAATSPSGNVRNNEEDSKTGGTP